MMVSVRADSARRRILVADQEPDAVAFILKVLRDQGHTVFHAYDGLSAVELAVTLDDKCHLVITNTRIEGMPGIELIHHLRRVMPLLPILYIATPGYSTPALERTLPDGVPILRTPCSAEELIAAVSALLVTDARL